MFISPYATSKTRKILGLFVDHNETVARSLVADVQPDYERNLKVRSRQNHKGSCTKPPRVRENLSSRRKGIHGPVENKSRVYPGGKRLRKALTRLSCRVSGIPAGSASPTNWSHPSLTSPGSMTK